MLVALAEAKSAELEVDGDALDAANRIATRLLASDANTATHVAASLVRLAVDRVRPTDRDGPPDDVARLADSLTAAAPRAISDFGPDLLFAATTIVNACRHPDRPSDGSSEWNNLLDRTLAETIIRDEASLDRGSWAPHNRKLIDDETYENAVRLLTIESRYRYGRVPLGRPAAQR